MRKELLKKRFELYREIEELITLRINTNGHMELNELINKKNMNITTIY